MNVFLKYGSIFVAVTALIIGSNSLNINARDSTEHVNNIGSYTSQNSPLLNEFNSRVHLQGPEYFLATDQEDTNLVLRYQININSQKPVHSVEWLTLYTYQGHIIFNKEFQIVFNSGMDQHQTRSVDFVFPIESVSRNNRIFFLSPNPEIEAITLPQSIQYLDGGRLEVPY
ncbi:hypothetical protein A1D23_02565 [Chelonobacter oris]|uniref:hypothetical protein n=1 Tax=Chelonobacter oris TaxID=505317 RepID=UPI00244876AC|nr:hypothetical protein [Chelonobacter oris]MDH3001404.1 hypothetical protein [Chelonobacter oris]